MNPLEGMKAVYEGKVYTIAGIYYGLGTVSLVEGVGTRPEKLDKVTPLLRFPEKDRQEWSPPEMWSGDLIRISIEDLKDQLVFIFHTGREWLCCLISLGDNYVSSSEDFTDIYDAWGSSNTKRLCSIFDKEATEHLSEEAMKQLKEKVLDE